MTEQGVLFEPVRVITAHCFFTGRCRHVESGKNPQEVHDRMEEHYARFHQPQIDRIVGATR